MNERSFIVNNLLAHMCDFLIPPFGAARSPFRRRVALVATALRAVPYLSHAPTSHPPSRGYGVPGRPVATRAPTCFFKISCSMLLPRRVATSPAQAALARPSFHKKAGPVARRIARSRRPRSQCTSRKLPFPLCSGLSLPSGPGAHRSIELPSS